MKPDERIARMFGREPADESREMTRPVIQMRPQTIQRSPLEHAAAWMRSLRYEDMMQMATEMHGIKADDPIDTPEQMAKLLHAWAKATTEPQGTD